MRKLTGPESESVGTTRLKRVLALGLAGAVLGGCAGVQRPDGKEEPSIATRSAVELCLMDADFVGEEAKRVQENLAKSTEDGCDQAIDSMEGVRHIKKVTSDCFGSIRTDSLADCKAMGSGRQDARAKWEKLGLKELRRQIRRQCYGPRTESAKQ